ncbi:endo-1,4-beta-xylanase 4-like [Phragmites australis]|uniref:endo-1,4-beta-xylanase 4-like n=1 Tax=Phragmites australis TaxID=29695 RepID=UPI002D783554|nr:endo-1,4-beta-xylanase 4-like [Phragmites australis]
MKVFTRKLILFLSLVLFEGCLVRSEKVSYDYTASIECVKEPEKPLYGGGIISSAEAPAHKSAGGKKLLMAKTKSSAPVKGSVLKVELQKDHHYALSAWLQLSKGAGDISAVIVTPDGKFNTAGVIAAQSGCWTLLKGGATSFAEGKGDLFFESNSTAEIMAESIALQGFSFDEWKAHRDEDLRQERKKKVKITVESDGSPVPDAELSVEWVAKGFPLGNAMTKEILDMPEYEEWFTKRFKWATMENEMKWYSTEFHEGHEEYEVADKMLELAQKHNISVRGHNVLWDDQSHQMEWVSKLSLPKLKEAVAKRLKSVVSRYAGKLIHWDVVNENLHFNFFEDKLGKDASGEIFKEVAKLDDKPILFMNEFNTLEQPNDPAPLPTKYLAKLKQIQSYAGKDLKYGIGLESHFDKPNIPYMRGSLDTLAAAKVPIWLTEVDVTKGPKQVEYLEEVMREGFAHPGVKGIVLWAAWHAKGCYVMCLTDNNFKNLPVGDTIDKLLEEWRKVPEKAKTDDKGVFEAELFHGEYNVTVKHKSLKEPVVRTVDLDSKSEATIKA